MMNAETSPPNGNGPLSWRDVYKAVEGAKSDVLAAIADVHTDVKDHETRLRLIEQFGTLPLQNVKTDLVRLDARVIPLEDAAKSTSAAGRERARLAAIVNKSIVSVILISNFIVGITVIVVNAISERSPV